MEGASMKPSMDASESSMSSHQWTQDPENEMTKPTMAGMLNVLKSCAKASTVRRVVFTSSTGTMNAEEHKKPTYDESCWSYVESCGGNMKEVKHLLDLPHANKKLTLWKADLVDEGSFDEAVEGCIGVFHLATPLDFETSDPENEMIKPTINGMLNLLRSCVKASVQRVVFTSSAGAVCIPGFFQQPVYDENSWTDVEVCRAQKMTGWMYFAGKTLAEKAAWEFSEEHNLDSSASCRP